MATRKFNDKDVVILTDKASQHAKATVARLMNQTNNGFHEMRITGYQYNGYYNVGIFNINGQQLSTLALRTIEMEKSTSAKTYTERLMRHIDVNNKKIEELKMANQSMMAKVEMAEKLGVDNIDERALKVANMIKQKYAKDMSDKEAYTMAVDVIKVTGN